MQRIYLVACVPVLCNDNRLTPKHVIVFSSHVSPHNVFQGLRSNQLLANFKLQRSKDKWFWRWMPFFEVCAHVEDPKWHGAREPRLWPFSCCYATAELAVKRSFFRFPSSFLAPTQSCLQTRSVATFRCQPSNTETLSGAQNEPCISSKNHKEQKPTKHESHTETWRPSVPCSTDIDLLQPMRAKRSVTSRIIRVGWSY